MTTAEAKGLSSRPFKPTASALVRSHPAGPNRGYLRKTAIQTNWDTESQSAG